LVLSPCRGKNPREMPLSVFMGRENTQMRCLCLKSLGGKTLKWDVFVGSHWVEKHSNEMPLSEVIAWENTQEMPLSEVIGWENTQIRHCCLCDYIVCVLRLYCLYRVFFGLIFFKVYLFDFWKYLILSSIFFSEISCLDCSEWS
jgi:hypothetical protein